MQRKWRAEAQGAETVRCLSASLPSQEIKNILVIKLRHFGDVLLMTPLLRTLKMHYPHGVINVLVYDGTEVMLAGNKDVYLCYTVDRQLKHQGVKAQWRGEKALWNSLSIMRYDLVINLSDQWRAALYCLLLKPAFSLGFRWPRRNNIFWRKCHHQLVDTHGYHQHHTVLNNLSVLQPLAISPLNTQVSMCWRKEDADYIDRLLHRYHLRDYVLIHPGARWAFKTWSTAAFSALINHLSRQGRRIVLTGGRSQEEGEKAAAILAGLTSPEHVVNLTGRLEMPELAVVISRARLFIGVDSAPMHMAAALSTPSVVLFGPSNVAQWHPWQAPHTLLWAGDYRPLPRPDEVDTATPERYLDAIPVSDVIRAVDQWLVPALPAVSSRRRAGVLTV
ncbi:putative lipopolysaccharide heptosyltransferase III [Nissabacter archeti]|uniref:Lipopolysaccharide heptosyltransferase III n=2 Tax=Nissabacter archeti TaxID=1917880 RepID=A0ABS5JMS8_9GAMM|nr:putative lipopolysaccharide heptosyltransferase III [Nissabacter archeti]MBS0971308.1 putative lipopolysaccharide heptosyltransferase III [Nissabacter archeti]